MRKERKTIHIHLVIDKKMMRKIEKLHGLAKEKRSRSEFVRQMINAGMTLADQQPSAAA